MNDLDFSILVSVIVRNGWRYGGRCFHSGFCFVAFDDNLCTQSIQSINNEYFNFIELQNLIKHGVSKLTVILFL